MAVLTSGGGEMDSFAWVRVKYHLEKRVFWFGHADLIKEENAAVTLVHKLQSAIFNTQNQIRCQLW